MRDETLVCRATRVWRSLWRDSQQIMSRVSAQNRVLYFEPGRDPDRPVGAELRRNWPNFLNLRVQKVAENLLVIPTPACLPYARQHLPRAVLRVTVPLVARVNSRILIRHVRQALHALAVERPILWLYDPRHVGLAGQFGEKMVCYYNYDEYPDALHNARVKESMRDYDARLTRRADVVFATSRAQSERRAQLNPHTYFMPNGVDFDLFNRALDADLPLPPDIVGLPQPIIGFAGWLGYHIDVELLRRIAETYRHGSLLLVGPDDLPAAGRQMLRRLPNVFFVGRKDPAELPGYLRAFDAALMPYALIGHIRSAYPLKLHEYLAAGRACVAVALPELEPYRQLVRIAETHDEFIRHIRAALDDNTPEAIAARVAVARENTWDGRVGEIYRLLDQRLAEKTQGAPHEEHIHRLDPLRPAT
jgi:glycosyltransferase involved in cell wall biosynthesis